MTWHDMTWCVFSFSYLFFKHFSTSFSSAVAAMRKRNFTSNTINADRTLAARSSNRMIIFVLILKDMKMIKKWKKSFYSAFHIFLRLLHLIVWLHWIPSCQICYPDTLKTYLSIHQKVSICLVWYLYTARGNYFCNLFSKLIRGC